VSPKRKISPALSKFRYGNIVFLCKRGLLPFFHPRSNDFIYDLPRVFPGNLERIEGSFIVVDCAYRSLRLVFKIGKVENALLPSETYSRLKSNLIKEFKSCACFLYREPKFKPVHTRLNRCFAHCVKISRVRHPDLFPHVNDNFYRVLEIYSCYLRLDLAGVRLIRQVQRVERHRDSCDIMANYSHVSIIVQIHRVIIGVKSYQCFGIFILVCDIRSLIDDRGKDFYPIYFDRSLIVYHPNVFTYSLIDFFARAVVCRSPKNLKIG
jgi:hypothetical protein